MQQIMPIWFPKTHLHHTHLFVGNQKDNDQRDDILKKSCEILTKVYKFIESSSDTFTLDEVLQKAGISENTYIEALKLTHRGRTYSEMKPK